METKMEQGLTGLIGGSGLGDVLADKIENAKFHNVKTPFGKPSDRIMIGKIGKRRVAFINRHGHGHKLSPSEVPYAANIFALKKLGVHSIIATCAVGSLRGKIQPGELVIVDQFIDRTFRRQNTFFDGFGAVHTEMAQPTCNRLGDIIAEAAKKLDVRDASQRDICRDRRADVFDQGGIAYAQDMGRRPDWDDGYAGGEISQRGTNVLLAGSAGERLRLLEAAEEKKRQAGAFARDNRQPESGKRKLPRND